MIPFKLRVMRTIPQHGTKSLLGRFDGLFGKKFMIGCIGGF